MTAGDEVPIACALDDVAMADRIARWRDFVACSVLAVESEAATVRLVLGDGDAVLLAATALGQAEKRCCAFFDVSVELEEHRRCLVFRVPEGAEAALTAFAERLRSAP
jgi:hypothetical protein